MLRLKRDILEGKKPAGYSTVNIFSFLSILEVQDHNVKWCPLREYRISSTAHFIGLPVPQQKPVFGSQNWSGLHHQISGRDLDPSLRHSCAPQRQLEVRVSEHWQAGVEALEGLLCLLCAPYLVGLAFPGEV